MDVGGGLLPPRDLEVAPARRAAADEERTPIPRQQGFQAVDTLAPAKLDAEIEDVVAFLIDDGFRQSEPRDLRADHAARLGILIEDDTIIAERRKVTGDCQRCRPAAEQRNTPAVADGSRAGQAGTDITLEARRNALQAADRHRLLFYADPPAGRLAWPVAGTPENSGKDIGFPIDHVSVAVSPSGNQSDVFRDWGVSRTGPLTIHDLVEVVRCRNIGRFHLLLCTPRPRTPYVDLRGPPAHWAITVGLWQHWDAALANPARILVEPLSEFHPCTDLQQVLTSHGFACLGLAT